MTTQELSPEQAMDLQRYADILVRPVGRKTWRKAVVVETPHRVANWVVVEYCYTFMDRGEEVLHRDSHIAVPGQDHIRAR